MRTSPKTTKIMQLLRLRQVHNGVFIRVNKAALILLRLVEPYVTYGEPNLKSIRELVYKRGFGKVNKQRVPLTGTRMIHCLLVGCLLCRRCWCLPAALCVSELTSVSCRQPRCRWRAGQVWRHERRGRHPRDCHLRQALQGGQQLPVAVQAEVSRIPSCSCCALC